MVAYQIAFDLYESATQHFLRRVLDSIKAILPAPIVKPRPLEPPENSGQSQGEEMEVSEETATEKKEEGNEKKEDTEQAK